MVFQEEAIQTKKFGTQHRNCFCLRSKNVLQFASSLILPLMLGVFTVVITFQQQKLARDQRIEDMQLARQQRLEDKNESRLQREQDRDESRLQREQDRDESRLQREQDKNESQLQRDLQWNISQSAQEAQRNISQSAQQAQNKALTDQYQDGVLVAYIKEIGDLFEKNNGSLTSNDIVHKLARVKTRNVIRQLNGPRQTHVIRFLYEARQLTNTDESAALDISETDLIDIDFSQATSMEIEKMPLIHVYLRNCTFGKMKLIYVIFSSSQFGSVNFSSARLVNVDFSSAQLGNVNFSYATLDNVNFSSAYLFDVNFSSADLKYVNFSSAQLLHIKFSSARQLYNVNFSSSELYNVNFSSVDLLDVNFSSADLEYVSFSSADLLDVNFSSADLEYVSFSSAALTNVNFSSAKWLDNVDFSSAQQLYNVSFSSARLINVNFSSAKWLVNVDFSSAQLGNVNFSSAQLVNVNFSSTRFYNDYGLNHFDHAKMAYTIFVECLCARIDFSYTNLKGSSFHGAALSKANFSLANLQDADFTNTSITDSQLQSAISIRNAKLPNGTLGQGRNLVQNGDANCNISLVDHWKVQNGNITVMPSKEDGSECQFTLQSIATGAIISQQITLVGIWDSSFWRYSNVELQAYMSSGVSMELSGKSSNGTVLKKDITNSSQSKIIMRLQKDIQELEVAVKFNAHNQKYNSGNSWCDNIELFIDYDMLYKE